MVGWAFYTAGKTCVLGCGESGARRCVVVPPMGSTVRTAVVPCGVITIIGLGSKGTGSGTLTSASVGIVGRL